jgi:hypothetical protein
MIAALPRLALPARSRHALAILAVCLPVPLAAMTGLSLPLPAMVERLAAGLVPWIETAGVQANEALARGAVGSIGIVLDEVDLSTGEAEAAAAPRVVRMAARTKVERSGREGVSALPSSDRAPAGDESPRVEGTTRPDEAPRGADAPVGSPSPAPGAEEPVAEPTPTPTPTDPAPPPPTNDPDPIAPVVEVVDDTVDSGGKVIDDTTEAVEDVTGVPLPTVPPLPGLGK